jgi:hypothetical protein
MPKGPNIFPNERDDDQISLLPDPSGCESLHFQSRRIEPSLTIAGVCESANELFPYEGGLLGDISSLDLNSQSFKIPLKMRKS